MKVEHSQSVLMLSRAPETDFGVIPRLDCPAHKAKEGTKGERVMGGGGGGSFFWSKKPKINFRIFQQNGFPKTKVEHSHSVFMHSRASETRFAVYLVAESLRNQFPVRGRA